MLLPASPFWEWGARPVVPKTTCCTARAGRPARGAESAGLPERPSVWLDAVVALEVVELAVLAAAAVEWATRAEPKVAQGALMLLA